MKCRLIKNEICEVLAKIQGISGRKTNLFITSTVRLTGQGDGTIQIEATDLETDFSGIYPAEVEVPGSVCINAKKLYEILKSYPSDTILLNEIENRWIEIGENNLLFHIVGMNPDDFPEIGKDTETELIAVDSFQFKKLIEKNLSIPSQADEKRIYTQGLFFESHTDEEEQTFLRGVSTDSKRMVKYDMLSDHSFVFQGEEKYILIPKKGLGELLKFLDSPMPVRIGALNNRFVVVKESEIFSITLLEGGFPGYQDIMRKDPDSLIEFKRQELLMSLRRMSILSDDDFRSIIFSFEENKLTLMTSNPDLGESHEELSISYEREPFEVAFNPKFFMDALSLIEEDDAHVFIRNNQTPCIIKGKSDSYLTSVIMPIKI
ncbi:DNA polymerase-3 subunit beta [Desulfobotulus alkaliphilus]|uniref:Beta sliding clamp n=1 Tax=Desulfobotulus alkaliphilus TaxID=622671 RepID=A0A562S2E5_9BACT|nr:DNA polymerase III subunit beta [Desulfobotulus alkaliphilus]TWI75537.1 DNA polymerase-3 subunit beta [Desulfobotulus alkaliphilus]